MKKSISLILAVLMILPLFASCGAEKKTAVTPAEGETVLYVSPSGDDTADGTFDAPLATLAGAKEKVRSVLPDAQGAVTVYFRGGTYPVTETVSFDEKDSGREGAPVSYRAYPGETVRITGGVKVDPALIGPADMTAALPSLVRDEGARAALLQADLSSVLDTYSDLLDYQSKYTDSYYPNELYLGETAVTPARWPNYDGRESVNYVSLRGDQPNEFYEEDQTALLYFGDDLAERAAAWSDASVQNAYILGHLCHSWLSNQVRVLELNTEEKWVHVSRTSNRMSVDNADGPGCFLNIPEELDVPGESVVDRDARIVYFYPTEDFDADNVWTPTLLEDMITMNAVSHIVFEDLTFGYTRRSILVTDGVSDMTMNNCRLVHTSDMAARFVHAENIVLDGCEIGDTAHAALIFSGGDRNTLESAGIVIENCDIHDVNRDGTEEICLADLLDDRQEDYDYAPAIYAGAVGMTIRHNRIHGSAGPAISLRNNDILIEYNEIFDCCTEAADMGAIYYWNNPTWLGLVIRNNYFHDIGGTASACQFAIYTDCGSMCPDIYNNLFVRSAGMPNGDPERPKAVISLAQYAHVHNNIFVTATAIFRYGDWSAGTGIRQSDWVLYLYNRGRYAGMGTPDRFREVDFDSEAWHNKYDGTIWGNIYDYFTFEMLEEMDGLDDRLAKNKAAGISPYQTNEMDNNLLVDVDLIVNDNLEKSLKLHDNLTDGDLSYFVDAANGDYSLTEEGLAAVRETCPDFEPFTLDGIGPQK